MMNKKKTILGIIIFITLLTTCSLFIVITGYFVLYTTDFAIRSINSPKQENEFYTETGDWDYRRIPLIPPYQALNAGSGWYIELNPIPDKLTPSIWNIRKINVIGDIIVVYSEGDSLNGQKYDKLWHVIIPKEKIEKTFISEEDFLSYLKSRGLQDPQMYDVESTYKKFVEEKHLEWFPDE